MAIEPLITSVDAHAPREIAYKVEQLGVAKAKMRALTLLALSVLAGAFVALGALFFTIVVTGSELGFGVTRVLGGLSFSLGLILVVVGGAELFTGNILMSMAWASRRVTTRDIVRNWVLVYIGNAVGSLGTVALVAWGGIAHLGDGAVGETATKIALAKVSLPWGEAFARGILCNALVCLGVWLAIGGRSVADKIFAMIFPITAFVAIGFEHSVANWFFLPYGLALHAPLPTAGIVRNLVAVTAGNMVGGTLLVAGVYWIAYLRDDRRA
jgi:formate/nitrite transporter